MNPSLAPVLPDPPLAAPVLAWLGPRDVARARSWGAGFSFWDTYRDFVAERDALFVGFGAAGVSARFRRVAFGAFVKWMRLTGAPATVDALDEFAAHCAFRADRPEAPVIGRIGVPGDPDRNAVCVAGAQCVRVQAAIYGQWRDEFARIGLFAPPDLDTYATYVATFCVSAQRRAPRLAVSSS